MCVFLAFVLRPPVGSECFVSFVILFQAEQSLCFMFRPERHYFEAEAMKQQRQVSWAVCGISRDALGRRIP